MKKIIIFSDIDGTLTDTTTFSMMESAGLVSSLVARGVPIVLVSSRTRAEQRLLRQLLGLRDPYIVENGSAIIIPMGTFPFEFPHEQRMEEFNALIEFGVPVERVRTALAEARRQSGVKFAGFGELSTAEVAQLTGLDEAAAAIAQQRQYSEVIAMPPDKSTLPGLQAALAAVDDCLQIVPGRRFHTVMAAATNKGKAVAHLSALYQRQYGAIETVGVGNSYSDESLLATVDRPYLVQEPDATWVSLDGQIPIGKHLVRVPGIGPSGWRLMADEIINLIRPED